MQSILSRRTALNLLAAAAAFSLANPISPVLSQNVPLAIKGYDPVAYLTVGKTTSGVPAVEHVLDERRYRFANAGNRELFKADPVRYAPQFGNFCAMALAKGMIVVADPENWLITDGKLYVFGSPAPAGPALFQKDLAGNVLKANQNRLMLPKN